MILHRAGGGVILVWFVASFLFIQTLKDLRSNTTNFLANILTGGQLVLTSFSLELVRKRQGIYDTDGAVGTKNKEQLTDRSVAVGARTTKFDIYFAAICHCAAVHAQYCAYFLLESVATLQMLRGVEVWFILAFRYAQMVMSRGKDMESIACPSMSKLAGIALITASFVFAHSTDVRVSRGTPIILVTNMLMPARNIILKQTENSGGFRLLARVFSIVSLVYGSVCICVSSASVTQLISENLPKPQLFFGNIIWGAVYNAASLIYLYRDRVTVLDHAIVSLAKRVFTLLYTCIIDFDVSHWFNMLLTLTGYFLYYKCPSSTLTTRSQRMASAWLLLLSVLLYSLRGKFTYTLQQKPSVPNMVDAYAEELLEIDAPYDRLMTVSGGNIGNYVWQMGARTLVGSQVNRVSLDSRNLTGPTIIPVANILPSYNVSMKYPGTLKASSYLEELVRTSTGPFFIVGLGTQQGFDPDDDELKPHANIIRLFKTIHSKQNVHVAVRGHITSRVLRLSQAEHEVLGCPSLMLNPKKDLGELILQKSKVLADSKEAVFGIALPVNPDGVFISTVVTWLESYPMSSVILQSREDIRSVKKILDDLDTKFVDMLKRVHMFHSLSEWMRYARTLDFMISARIHGSMVTIANEIPTVLLAVDSRTEELGQFMNIPLLRITAMNATAFPPVELVRKHLIDANSFDAHRKELARRPSREYVTCVVDTRAEDVAEDVALALGLKRRYVRAKDEAEEESVVDDLFLYDPEDEYPLYTNIEEYFREELDEAQQDEVNDWDGMGAVNDVREDIIDTHKGLLCLAEDYRDDWQKFYFVRKATSKDLKRKEWKGQADRNWKKPKKSDGITRDELRDLVLAGKNEDKHTEALEQLYQEEDAFLKQAEKDLNKALGMFPYKKMTYTLEDGLGLLRGIDEKDQARCFEWGKYKMYVTTVSYDHDEATVHIKCEDFDETLTCGRWHCWCGMLDNGNDECCCFIENEYLQSLNPEGDLEELVYQIFEPFDLKDIPE